MIRKVTTSVSQAFRTTGARLKRSTESVHDALKAAWRKAVSTRDSNTPLARLEVSPTTGMQRLMVRHYLNITEQATGAMATLYADMEVPPHDTHYAYFWNQLSRKDQKILNAQQASINNAQEQIFFVN